VTKNIKFLNLISGPLVASQDVRRSGVNLKITFFVGRRDTKHNYTQNNDNLPNVMLNAVAYYWLFRQLPIY
jgi:hypothetical protein